MCKGAQLHNKWNINEKLHGNRNSHLSNWQKFKSLTILLETVGKSAFS